MLSSSGRQSTLKPEKDQHCPYCLEKGSHDILVDLQGGRSWQPFGEGKNGHKIVVKHIFTILATNALVTQEILF